MRTTFSELWKAIAEASPDRIAVRGASGREYTYGELVGAAGFLAETLASRGLRKGEVVGILLYNRPEFLIAFLACISAGFIPAPFNYRAASDELQYLLSDSGASAIIYPTSLGARLDGAVAGLDRETTIRIAVGDDDSPAPDAIDWTDAAHGSSPLPDAPDDTEIWIYTGGTTGQPKGVKWDERDMYASQMFSRYKLVGLPMPTSFDEAVEIAVRDPEPLVTHLPLAPLLHGTALSTTLNALCVGGTVLLSESQTVDATAAVEFANRENATRIVVAGDAIALPLAEAAEELGRGLPTVTAIMSSGMRLSAEAKRRLHRLGEMTIADVLASSEAGAFAMTVTNSAENPIGEAKLLPTAVVLDEDSREVQDEPGAIGVVGQRGSIPLGYHGDEERNRQVFPVINGVRYALSGDRVKVGVDRSLDFLGRGSSVINTGGEKVYPPEVEQVILDHPAVDDVVVLGVPHPRYGETVAAAVVATGDVDATEITDWVASRLAGYKKPRRVLFLPTLNRSPTGKASLRDIAARFSEKEGARP